MFERLSALYPSRNPASVPFPRPVNALIVDDSKVVRTMIGRMLRGIGFTTKEAGNGREALDVLTSDGPFDVVLLDWNMPVMDGYEALCAIRADARYASMRVLMVTTETEVERVTRALAAGANEYLMKPFGADALSEKLELAGVLTHASGGHAAVGEE
jgi:two-component system chemotaxis response regulator CheY